MALNIEIPEEKTLKPKITIFGVGGAGGNATNNMINSKLEGVEFVAANTDAQALENSQAKIKIQLGLETTKGLGAGSFPDRGKIAAEENIEEIEKALEGNHMIFIAAGMGGGTGTGAAPVIAKLAKERDILTVGVVTKPFHFEGKYRMETADKGIEELKQHVDTLIIIPNQNLFRIANERTTFESAFKMADDVLHAGVRGITDLITMPGLVNLDFADIRTVMTKMGKAMMGTGEAEGENRAVEACEAAISNPLLDDVSIRGARGVLVNMTGGPDMTLFEADLAVNTIKSEVDENANIIFGSAFDENMKGKIRISVVATGMDEDEFMEGRIIENSMPRSSKFNNKQQGQELNTRKKDSFFNGTKVEQLDDETIEEISATDFQSKKNYLEEENSDYGKSEFNPKQDDISKISRIDFLQDDSRNIVESKQEVQEVEAEKDHKKLKSKKAPNQEKKDSGFSLFSFMSSSKVKEEFEDENENSPVEESENEGAEDFEAFQEERQKKESSNRKNLKPKKIKKDLAAKKQEFFGSIGSQEDGESKASEHEEDILNVPAFFRKKK